MDLGKLEHVGLNGEAGYAEGTLGKWVKREPELETEQMGKSVLHVTIGRDAERMGFNAGHEPPDHRLERLANPGQGTMVVGALPLLRP